MRRTPSLSRRLLLAAAGFIAIAIVAAAIAIGFVLHRFVQGQIDQRLDTQIVFLSSMLRSGSDGMISLTASADGPPFDRMRRGWYWQVTGPGNVLRSQSLAGGDLDPPDIADRPPPPPPPDDRLKRGPRDRDLRDQNLPLQDLPHQDLPGQDRPKPADGDGPGGDRLHYRIEGVDVSGVPATIVVSAPRAAVWGPLREAMTTLGLSLGVLGLALVSAIMLQIRLGLRPLERLRWAVAEVRAGRSERVPSPQPLEIQPLVMELNGLLAQNADNLERARRHVANLAHGLKTPLATLAIAMSGRKEDRDNDLEPLVHLMERRIRHHLGRARVAALSGPVRARTVMRPDVEDLGGVLAKIHAGKSISLIIEVGDELAVACEQQDFDEMAGNLMENAFTWSRGQVAVRAKADGRSIVLAIEDDGPGLMREQAEQVLRPGERLDESAPGFGFGLSITRELAELYGGALELGPSSLGGLRASLRLPLALN